MRHVWLLFILAGCAGMPGDEPAAPRTAQGDDLNATSQRLVPVAPEPPMRTQNLWLEVYNGTWGRPDRIVATATGSVDEGHLDMEAPLVPVHVRADTSARDAWVHAWPHACCAPGANAPLVEGQGVLRLAPGTWQIEAYAFDNHTQWHDALTLEVRLEYTVEGTVWPTAVAVPGQESMHEIRLKTATLGGNIVMQLSSPGDVRDVRMALRQADWVQCSEPPRLGDLGHNEVFMEGFINAETRVARIQVGDVPACQGHTPAVNAEPAAYVLRISL